MLKNTYDLKLVQGVKTLDVADIVCTGETCDAGDVIADLTVDLSGSWLAGVNVELYGRAWGRDPATRRRLPGE